LSTRSINERGDAQVQIKMSLSVRNEFPVVPIYFDEGLIPFDKFLLQIAEILGLKADSFETKTSIEERKGIVRGLLNSRRHPLIYLDNFETVSLILNKEASTNSKELKLNFVVYRFCVLGSILCRKDKAFRFFISGIAVLQ
jgi:hypothetical protein